MKLPYAISSSKTNTELCEAHFILAMQFTNSHKNTSSQNTLSIIFYSASAIKNQSTSQIHFTLLWIYNSLFLLSSKFIIPSLHYSIILTKLNSTSNKPLPSLIRSAVSGLLSPIFPSFHYSNIPILHHSKFIIRQS